jgi:hypothetical protein
MFNRDSVVIFSSLWLINKANCDQLDTVFHSEEDQWVKAARCALRGTISFSPPSCQESDDIEIDSALPFETRQEMEIADILSGSLIVWLSPKTRPRSKSIKTFGASTVD